MRYIEFGESKRKVSEVVLGTMRIAPLEISQVCDLIDVALDAGINAIDTAPIYGPSESILGKVFETRPDLRDKVWLQTKFGIRKHPSGTFNYFDGSYEHIIESVDESLKALKVDHIDSLLFHRPDPLMEPQGVADAFDELKKAGKVIDFGVSNQNPPTMGRLERVLTVPITANQVQLSCAFTPMIDAVVNTNMENEGAVMRDGGILEYCAERDMAIQAWSVLQHGYFVASSWATRTTPSLTRPSSASARSTACLPRPLPSTGCSAIPPRCRPSSAPRPRRVSRTPQTPPPSR